MSIYSDNVGSSISYIAQHIHITIVGIMILHRKSEGSSLVINSYG
jgi:hypothetical protein